MSAATPIELTPAQPPGAARSGAPPGAPPGAQSFHGALEDELARTAPAEGQKEGSPEEASTAPKHEHSHTPGEGAEAPAGLVLAAVAAAATPGTSTPTPDPTTEVAVAPATPQSDSRASQGGQATAATGPSSSSTPSLEQPLPAAPEDAAPAVSADPSQALGEAAPIDVAEKGTAISHSEQAGPRSPESAAPGRSAEVSTPAAAVPQGPVKQDPTSAEPQITVQGTTVKQAPASLGSEADRPAATTPEPDPTATVRSEAQPTSAPAAVQGHESRPAPTVESSAGTGPATPAAQSADSGSTTQIAPAAPVVPSAGAPVSSGAQAPVLAAGVGMQEMIDSVRATIGLAVRQGISQARIALQPAELGEIRVHLSQGAEGLIARVTAGTEAAAQALASGRAELHHSLSTIGTSLLRLEIGSFNQPGQGRERHAGEASSSSGATAQDVSIEDEEPAAPLAAATEPRGELVDVLA